MKLLTYEEFLEKQLQDPEFRKEWEASEEEFQQELARLKAEIAADEAAGIVHHPTYEEAIAWIKDYEVANA